MKQFQLSARNKRKRNPKLNFQESFMELMSHRDQKGDISRVMRQTTDSDLIIELSLLLLRRIGKPSQALFILSPTPFSLMAHLNTVLVTRLRTLDSSSKLSRAVTLSPGCEGHSDLISLSFQVKSTTLRSCNLCWLVSIFCFDGDLDCSQSSH